MGTGDYICVTLRGGAPWGFTLREGEGDIYRPFLISQVEEGGRAFLAGVQEGDEVVSLNGEPCADLTLLRAFALIDTSVDCLQLLLKRYCIVTSEDYESEETHCGQRNSAALETTTLHILSSKESQSPRELYISESPEEPYCAELTSNILSSKGPQLLSTELHIPSSIDQRGQESSYKKTDGVRHCFSPGKMVELQVSMSEQTLDDLACSSLGCAVGIQGDLSNREAFEMIPPSITTQEVPCPVREPLGQHGVVLSSPSMLGQVEVILQQTASSGAGRGILSVGGSRVSGSAGSQNEGEEGGEHGKGIPGSFTVSFGIPSEEVTPAEEEEDSEGDQDKPNKHRPRHARLRRSESLSEKQVKEAKSKCKRIALLLTAAPPNPNNKGVLMFKKHQQRAKKYTLVSYGTGEDEPEYSDEEDEENEKGENNTVRFTFLAPDISEISTTNADSSEGVLTFNFDKGLLEIERNLNNQDMECLPETKGKGALMFAQRRQRMDEISAEHEELRRQGIPVEGIVEAEKKIVEHSCMQSTTEGHAYMDVNIHQQSQQQQQYQQYQEQQYYEQQNYQQQQYQKQYQQQEYAQQHYQQQQMYPPQEYHQERQQMEHYSTNINGTVQHQSSEMQSSFSNRTAKPFSAGNMVPTPYAPVMSGTNQDSVGQGEQIASRDERIATPAIKTGLLLESKKRNAGKPMFTFKEAPKISPNPELLNLLNRADKKPGFESGAEEDYLSLGAEACNFLQSPVKHKTPPPVAPKPVINPNSLPWPPQIEVANQDVPQQAENSVSTPAVAPTTEPTHAAELEPTTAPAPEPSPPPAPQDVPASTNTEEHTWTPPEPESQQQPLQMKAQDEYGQMNSTLQPEPAPVTSWAPAQTQVQPQPPSNSWPPAQIQSQEPSLSQSPAQPPWVNRHPAQNQAPLENPTNNWTPQNQPSWGQPQEQVQAQTNAQPPWVQPQEQIRSQPPWTHPHEQPNPQQMQPTWGQPQDQPMQQPPQAPWAHPPQHSQPQPPWVQQPQQKTQVQPPWAQQAQPESIQQPPWVQQPQHQAPQQAWPQPEAPGQPQPPWASSQPQQQQQQQQQMNVWPAPQTEAPVQPPWIQAGQIQPAAQPQINLNQWAPAPAQPPWAQHPPAHVQQPMSSWSEEQPKAQHQPPWAHAPPPPQPTPQPNWQPSSSTSSPQPPINTWAASQTQPQAPVNAWAPQSQQTPVNVSMSTVNTRPSPKPWSPPQNRTPPSPPQRMHSFTIGQRAASPINPMATVLNPSSAGPAFEMPLVRGKGADMFAKRQSRMEKFVVDSETVQANKASRSTSPAASLPNEWKYTPNALGRSYSLSPPARAPSTGQKSPLASSSPKPPTLASTALPAKQTSWPDKVYKPPTPWEAASRHPLGLVDEAFSFQSLQQTLASNVRLAAQRKMLPVPPVEWKSRVSYQTPQKTGSQTWSQSQSRSSSRAPLPSFVSPPRSTVSTSASFTSNAGYRSLPRQWQPHRPVAEANLGTAASYSQCKSPFGKQTYKSVSTSNNWSWKR